MRMQREFMGLRQAGCLPKNMHYRKAKVQIHSSENVGKIKSIEII